jgi:acyl dehydratase
MGAVNAICSVDELKGYVGREVGVGDWFELTQERVDAFADVTGDHQWIHVDVERARSSPFGGTIAHGLLLLSCMPLTRGYELRLPVKWGLNYGYDRIRFPASAPVGRRLRLRSRVLEVTEPAPNQLQLKMEHQVEVEGVAKPAMVAEQLTRYSLEGS